MQTTASIDLHSNHFMERLLEIIRPIVEKAAKSRSSTASERRPKVATPSVTLAEMYTLDVFQSATELISVCDQLEFAAAFVGRYRRHLTARGNVISRADHIAYHIENFLIRTVTISDRALKLVNIVFQLGIPTKECRRATVEENAHVARTSVRARLKELDRQMQDHRHQRNQVVHHERYKDQELSQLEGFFVVEKASAKDSPFVKQFHAFFKARTDEYVRQRKNEMGTTSSRIVESVAGLFTELEPIFVHRYSQFVSRDGAIKR